MEFPSETLPTPKESGLSFEETTLKENSNSQTHMNSSETSKAPVCECVPVGGALRQGDGGERCRDTRNSTVEKSVSFVLSI